MRATVTLSLLASVLATRPELFAAGNQRPHPTTIFVVSSNGQAEANAESGDKPAPRTALSTKRPAVRAPLGQNSVQFMLPDRGMGAWIEPAQVAAEVRPVTESASALRVASREPAASSRLVVVQANRQAESVATEPSEAPTHAAMLVAEQPIPQTPAYRMNSWRVFSEKPASASVPTSATASGDSCAPAVANTQTAAPAHDSPTERPPVARPGEPTLAQGRRPARVTVKLAPAAPPLPDSAMSADRTFPSGPTFMGELPRPAATIVRF